jgi:signal transduction histidine kinase
MMDEQNRFIGDASHEFRTPLTALKSSMEVFLKDPNAKMDDANELIRGGIDDVDCMTQLSDSLLQMAQYQKPNGNIKFETVDLDRIITDAVSKIKPLADKKKIIVEYQKTGLKVTGNKYSLTDLLVILLDNAVKFSSKDGKIGIETQALDHTVQITIKDFGIGIDEKDLPYIFDRFYKADTSRGQTADSKQGYGLGLSIAQSVVKSHRGNIKAESIYGSGTTITVCLPASKDDSVNIQEV